MSHPQSGQAIVKSIVSGDTVVLKGKSGSEMTFSLNNVNAPLFTKSQEEPFGFESREYLRQLLIGKSVKFRVEHSGTNRQYGQLFVQQPVNGETNVSRILVQAGWIKTKTIDPKKSSDEFNELVELEALARKKTVGLWAEQPEPRLVRQAFDSDPRKFILEHKNKPIPSIST
jgi:staphylococcal nuclease domain-containing protein 1